MGKMYCSKCGAENDNAAKHCSECGAKLSTDIVSKKEKNSFIKEHGKVVLSVAGILVIFMLFASISIVSSQTNVDDNLSLEIEKVLKDNGYNVSRSVKDSIVKLNAVNFNITGTNSTNELTVLVLINPYDILSEIVSKNNLSPKEINGINGYGGYTNKMYTYAYVDNGSTIVIVVPSKHSVILNKIVKDY